MKEPNSRLAFVTDPLRIQTAAAAAYLTLCGHELVRVEANGNDYVYLFPSTAKGALRRWEAFSTIRAERNRVRYAKQGRA